MVLIQYYGAIRDYTRCAEETVDAPTLGHAMDFIKARYGKEALKTMKASLLTVNGVRVETCKRSLPLPNGAALGIFPLCCGG